MLVGLEAIAKELFLEPDDGSEPLSWRVEGAVTFQIYRHDGVLAVEVDGGNVTLSFMPDPDLAPPTALSVAPAGGGEWSVVIS